MKPTAANRCGKGIRRLRLAAVCLVLVAPAFGATWVVDREAPGAADTNPGTEIAPFRSLQRGLAAAQPGDTVFVMAGRYDERVRIQRGGAEGRPLAVIGRPRHAVRVAGFDLDADFVRIEGFEITAPRPGVAVQLNGRHDEVVDNRIHDMMVGVAGTVGKPAADGGPRDYGAVAHHRIVRNRVEHCEYGFMLGGDDWIVEANEVTRLFMYADGKRFDDADYARFFGTGCLLRWNYFHGSRAEEIRVAHVDGLQTFTVNGEIARDVRFEENTCFDFHQLCMVESAPHPGNVRNWTLRRNIVSACPPGLSGGWGPDIIQTPDVTIDHNTIAGVRWACIGLRGQESTHGQIRNNLLGDAERAVVHGDRDFTAANPSMTHNVTFRTAPLTGEGNRAVTDPGFVDAAARNFRLRADSPARTAAADGTAAGALDWPNVYVVDQRHPAAADQPAWGYPAVPFATLAGALAAAKPGETILVRAGIYRETLRPVADDVRIAAAPGDAVQISGADLIEGWRREPDGAWSAPLATKPKRLLRDGRPWTRFRYDGAAHRVTVTGFDPRLHELETVVRPYGLETGGHPRVRVDGIEVVHTLKAARH